VVHRYAGVEVLAYIEELLCGVYGGSVEIGEYAGKDGKGRGVYGVETL
jgi:hypothetical protein